MFRGRDSYERQSTGHSDLHFSTASCRGNWHPKSTFIQQYLLRDFFVLVSMPGTLVTQFLLISHQSPGSERNSNQVIKMKGFRIT